MGVRTGQVFSLTETNAPVPGCTVSEAVLPGVIVFSLAAGTDISAELHPYRKLLLGCGGVTEALLPDGGHPIRPGELLAVPADTLVGLRSAAGAVYTEIDIGRNEAMNSIIKAGEVFQLANLVPTQAGRIVNMDIVSNDKMKFVVMSFAAGTGLSEHAAPGEAVIFALEGEGIIRYEGQDHVIRAGEQFSFARGGMHAVMADQPFKMALLLTL